MAKLGLLLAAFWNLHLLTHVAHTANVLAVFPSVWKSHYLFGRSLMQQLAEHHNHSVTLLSPHDSGDDAPSALADNIREIRIPGLQENWLDMDLSFNVEQIRQKSTMERFTRLFYAGTTNVDLLLSDPQVTRLLQSGEQFDLLVVDLFLSDALLGLAYYYKVPTVVVSPNGANTWLNQMNGNPQSSALDPSNFLPYSERMTTWERCVNTLMVLFEKLTYNFFHMISQQAIYVKHFQSLCQGNDRDPPLPHHRELTKNLSLVLLNSHPVVQYPRAYLPNMMEIGGSHLQHDMLELQLPQYLDSFISGAAGGVIYMSLGANLRTVDLAREKLDALLHVFETLTDMRVLLKWESAWVDEQLPPNVFISDWFPQQALLAHDNVKLFITTGGVMSVIEAIDSVTPLLMIPIYPDQEVMARRLEQQGCALVLPFESLGYSEILNAIETIRSNASYGERVQQQRLLLHDSFGAPASRAVHYMELVMKTAGADHLKSHANHLGFLRSELVDVLLILLAGASCIIAVPFLVTCCILRKSYLSNVSNLTERVPLRVAAGGERAGAGDQLVRRRRTSTSASGSSSSSSGSPGGTLKQKQKPKRDSQSSQPSD